MNKIAIALALVSVLIGLVAISNVDANFLKKGGEHKSHHHKGHKGHHHKPEGGEHHHHKPEGGEHHHHKPEGGEHHHHKPEGGEHHHHKPHHVPLGPGPVCHCPKTPSCGPHRHHPHLPHHGGGHHHHPHHEGGGEGEGHHGGFEGAGFGFGFKKDKELDAGVRVEDKERDRNQFNRHQGFVAGEQGAFSGGEGSSDVNTVEGVHKRKNHNNNKVVVSESNRGNEDVDGFKLQNGHSQESHFAGEGSKFVGAENDESGSQEHDSDKEFEAGIHKKDEVEGFGGAGAFKQF